MKMRKVVEEGVGIFNTVLAIGILGGVYGYSF